ncbi:MAG: beta-ketoacyl-ACP synthase [Pseudomonadota bacterium]
MTIQTASSSRDRIGITAMTGVSAVGRGRADHVEAMRDGRSGLTPCDFPNVDVECFIGRVAGIEDEAFPQGLAHYDNRANRLSLAALGADGFDETVREANSRWGASRIGTVIGTSTSGVERLETTYRAINGEGVLAPDYSIQHNNDHHAAAAFLVDHLGLRGPAYTISTACSSSAKAFIDAEQMIRAGLADAVLVGGVDSLCMTSIYGFEALELVSRAPCRPFDATRDGLSIGEAAGFALLERGADGPVLSGYGESSDATSMSTPPPDGAGAAAAMRRALARAGLEVNEVDFLKLHGTATPINDSAETAAVASVFGPGRPAASLKGMIGHTLGAAGAIEAVLSLYAMEEGLRPGSVGLCDKADDVGCDIQREAASTKLTHVLNNAFGFGGSNCSLILSAG